MGDNQPDDPFKAAYDALEKAWIEINPEIPPPKKSLYILLEVMSKNIMDDKTLVPDAMRQMIDEHARERADFNRLLTLEG